MRISSVFLLVIVILLNCSSEGSEATANATLSTSLTGYSTTYTPQSTSVDAPGSISLSSSVAQAALKFALNSSATGNTNGIIKQEITNYSDQIAYNLAMIEIYKIFADELRVNNKINVSTESSSNCIEPNSTSLYFTQTMLNSMIKIENEYNVDSSSGRASDAFSSMVNTSITPPQYYNWFTKTGTTSDPYTNVLIVGVDNDACSTIGTNPSRLTLKYTDISDNANLKALASFYFSESGLTYLANLGFDAAKKLMTLKLDIKFSSGGVDFRNIVSFSLRECSGSEQLNANEKCAIFRYNSRVTTSGVQINTIGRGKADNNGGIGEAKYLFNEDAFYYREVWDSTGGLTYVGYKDKSTDSWSDLSGSDSSSYNETTYTTSSHSASVIADSNGGSSINITDGKIIDEGYYVAVIQGETPSDSKGDAIVGYYMRETIDDDGTDESASEAEYWGPQPAGGDSIDYTIYSLSGDTYTKRQAKLRITGN